LRHAEVGELVDDGHPNMGLDDLPVIVVREEALAQLLEPMHHALGQAAPVVTGVLLPAAPPLGGILAARRDMWV
jgi:hypothetical protein